MADSGVGGALLAYGRELDDAAAAQVGGSFSGSPPADALLESDPNAFLIGVLFTQGIPAERAWQGPYLLRERLGTIEPSFLAHNPEAVRAAMQLAPMLHRFKETMPRWISRAAVRLVEQYDGQAANIWPDGAHVLAVVERLVEFDGIGRKKAVMAAEILARHYGVALEGRECGQVAYDVQVRRVFLRTGLASLDRPDAIEAAAAAICPESPGSLDLAAWLVGRETCRPKSPLCDRCRLGDYCPRLVWITPQGVGARTAESVRPYSAERNTSPDGSLG
jgi:uncharacterized HhH-GPD family protein